MCYHMTFGFGSVESSGAAGSKDVQYLQLLIKISSVHIIFLLDCFYQAPHHAPAQCCLQFWASLTVNWIFFMYVVVLLQKRWIFYIGCTLFVDILLFGSWSTYCCLNMLVTYFAEFHFFGGPVILFFAINVYFCFSSLAVITFSCAFLVNNVFIPQFYSRISWLAVRAEWCNWTTWKKNGSTTKHGIICSYLIILL